MMCTIFQCMIAILLRDFKINVISDSCQCIIISKAEQNNTNGTQLDVNLLNLEVQFMVR